MDSIPPPPVLSILGPVCNIGALFEPCLRSFAAQQDERIGFLCLDNGSSNGSAEVLDTSAARDKRFRSSRRPTGKFSNMPPGTYN